MMCGHEWKETGEQGAHIDFKYQGASGRHRHARVFAIYVRCVYCGQQGFRKPGSRVVYTWRGDGENPA